MKDCKTRKEPRNVLADSLSLPLGVINNRPIILFDIRLFCG